MKVEKIPTVCPCRYIARRDTLTHTGAEKREPDMPRIKQAASDLSPGDVSDYLSTPERRLDRYSRETRDASIRAD